MFVLIVGAGRVGSAVAKAALTAGHEVSVLDEDPLSHERLDVGGEGTWEDRGGLFTVGTATHAYATFNVGDSLLRSGRCRESLTYFHRARKLEAEQNDRAQKLIRLEIRNAQRCLQHGASAQAQSH